ncbi:MAG: type I-E CRISPR-associated endoribonuclease Cas2e [Chloroflexi bacterium]|nr:type I-E CRISPR-associated endoribonuclease Cas2e [Chloroflexota bacterium]
MIVILLERASPSVRGELSRWLVEPQTGVFVGNVSAMVRDKLWELTCARLRRAEKSRGGALLIWNTNNEQGFGVRSYGCTNREVIDFDGLSLILRPRGEPSSASPPAEVQEQANM